MSYWANYCVFKHEITQLSLCMVLWKYSLDNLI